MKIFARRARASRYPVYQNKIPLIRYSRAQAVPHQNIAVQLVETLRSSVGRSSSTPNQSISTMAYQDPYTEQSRPKQTRFSEELNPYGTSQPYQAYYPGAGPSYGNYEEYKDDPQHDCGFPCNLSSLRFTGDSTDDNGFPRRPSGPNDNDYLGGSPPRKRY